MIFKLFNSLSLWERAGVRDPLSLTFSPREKEPSHISQLIARRSLLIADFSSIQLKFFLPIGVFLQWLLVFFI